MRTYSESKESLSVKLGSLILTLATLARRLNEDAILVSISLEQREHARIRHSLGEATSQ